MKKALIILAAALLVFCVVSCADPRLGTLEIDFMKDTVLAQHTDTLGENFASVTDIYLAFEIPSRKAFSHQYRLPLEDLEKGKTSVPLLEGEYIVVVFFYADTEYCDFEVVKDSRKTYNPITITAGKTTKAVLYEN